MIYPSPRVLPNEIVKGPQLLVQVVIVLAPRVGLRRLASSWEWREISRDQAVPNSPGCRHVHRNRREGPERVHEHLQADIFLSQKA